MKISGIESLLSIIENSFYIHNNFKLTINEDKAIKFSNLITNISFHVENFENITQNTLTRYHYDDYESHIQKSRKIYWLNKEPKILDDTIYSFFTEILRINKLSAEFAHAFYQATIYLMCCSALKEGRDAVTCEDVVIGYLTYFKIIFTDIRPLVYKYYDEEKWMNKNVVKDDLDNTIEEIENKNDNKKFYTKNKFVKCWPKESDQIAYEESLKELYKWKDVPRLDELIEILDSLCGDKHYLSMGAEEQVVEFEEDIFEFNMKKIPIYYGMDKAFGFLSEIPIYLPQLSKKLVEFDHIVALFALIQSNFVEYGGHYLKYEQDKAIKLSDIIYMITFYIDDYDNPKNQIIEHDEEYYVEFFKKIHNTYWEDERPDKLESDIRTLLGDISWMNHLSYKCQRTLVYAAIYIMACNALKNNTTKVNCEDVVIAYITCFKILQNNIKPLVYKLYDETKWLNEKSYK